MQMGFDDDDMVCSLAEETTFISLQQVVMGQLTFLCAQNVKLATAVEQKDGYRSYDYINVYRTMENYDGHTLYTR